MVPAAYGAARQSGTGAAWITTFTDLAALMLTFFVLQFSMSKIDQVQWQNVLNSFQVSLTSLQQDVVPSPMAILDIARPNSVPGRDLNYLSSVLEEQLRREDLAKVVVLHRRPDHLRLSLPTAVFAEGRHGTLRDIASLLASLENDIDVVGYAQNRGQRTARPLWSQALAKAAAAAGKLANAGFTRRIAVSGRVIPKETEGAGNRIDVIIHANVQQGANP